MMRELSKKKLGLAVLAGLGATAAANSANAALITIQLRPTSSTSITNTAGNTVSFDIYAVITGADANHTNDGYNQSFFRINSVEASGPTGALGNLQAVSIATAANAGQSAGMSPTVPTGISQPGLVQNLDGNATDLEVGNTNNGTGNDWVSPQSGPATVMGTASNNGAGTTTEFLLGSSVWTYNGGADNGATTALSVSQRVASGNLTSAQTVKYTVDGVVKSEKGDNANVAQQGFSITVTPEPASLGLLGLGAMGLIARRRRPA